MTTIPHEPIPGSSDLDSHDLLAKFEYAQSQFDAEHEQATTPVEVGSAHAFHTGHLRVLLAQAIARLRMEESERDGAELEAARKVELLG